MKPISFFLSAIVLFSVFSLAGAAVAQTENVLYSFTGRTDGANPSTAPVFDKSGNLFAVTGSGGAYFMGGAYELSLSNRTWTETTIYSFCPSRGPCPDGSAPNSNLIFDAEGNLYGTALGGNSGCGNNGCGVVFELTPSGDAWTESVLYTFTGGVDGAWPTSNLVFDKNGSLYGTTLYGGTGSCHVGIVSGCGTVFELSKGPGGWTESVLHSFQGLDGDTPMAGVILDSAGNLYGTVAGASPTDPGLVFRLKHTQSGWKENILYRFTGKADGNSPEAPVIFDKAGNLYGTTRYGGTGTCTDSAYRGCGVVFQLSLSNGRIKETVFHDFQGGGSDGSEPAAGLIFDKLGGLDGTTAFGGATGFCGTLGCGTVFRLTQGSGGHVREMILHRFDDSTGDGAYPLTGFVADRTGNLYSTTQYGGAGSEGTVFEISQ